MTKRVVRVRDLTNQIGTPYPRASLHCFECGADYSAHRGDYFMAAPDTVFKCCNRPMRLVRKETVYRDVT